jgi:hypothetical protein
VGPYRQEFCGLRMMLRKVDGAFSFIYSHGCLL